MGARSASPACTRRITCPIPTIAIDPARFAGAYFTRVRRSSPSRPVRSRARCDVTVRTRDDTDGMEATARAADDVCVLRRRPRREPRCGRAARGSCGSGSTPTGRAEWMLWGSRRLAARRLTPSAADGTLRPRRRSLRRCRRTCWVGEPRAPASLSPPVGEGRGSDEVERTRRLEAGLADADHPPPDACELHALRDVVGPVHAAIGGAPVRRETEVTRSRAASTVVHHDGRGREERECESAHRGVVGVTDPLVAVHVVLHLVERPASELLRRRPCSDRATRATGP